MINLFPTLPPCRDFSLNLESSAAGRLNFSLITCPVMKMHLEIYIFLIHFYLCFISSLSSQYYLKLTTKIFRTAHTSITSVLHLLFCFTFPSYLYIPIPNHSFIFSLCTWYIV